MLLARRGYHKGIGDCTLYHESTVRSVRLVTIDAIIAAPGHCSWTAIRTLVTFRISGWVALIRTCGVYGLRSLRCMASARWIPATHCVGSHVSDAFVLSSFDVALLLRATSGCVAPELPVRRERLLHCSLLLRIK